MKQCRNDQEESESVAARPESMLCDAIDYWTEKSKMAELDSLYNFTKEATILTSLAACICTLAIF